jgi:hypothetical protein
MTRHLVLMILFYHYERLSYDRNEIKCIGWPIQNCASFGHAIGPIRLPPRLRPRRLGQEFRTLFLINTFQKACE